MSLRQPDEVRPRNMIVLNDQLVARSFYAYNWPSQIYPNWMSQLINFDL